MFCNKKSGGCLVAKIACALVVVGALNWGLVGLFGFDLVAAILGDMTALSRAVYVLVGISGVIKLFGCMCKTCKKSCSDGSSCGPKDGACCGPKDMKEGCCAEPQSGEMKK